ncbi:hypothetical protein FDECE_17438 [Fusarium decemcellulare]|nr:hypothetical protein FDECE_17438 [Fusarium decemcellulare]
MRLYAMRCRDARSLLHRAPSTKIHHVLRPIPVPQCSRTLSTTSLARSEAIASQKESPWIPSPEVQLPQTLTEKIVQRYAVGLPQGKVVRSGDYISLAPEFYQIVMTLDHDVQNTSPANLQKYQKIEAFAKQQGTQPFSRLEEVLGTRSCNHYGGVGCLGTAIVRTDGASIWATSRTWWRCPPIARVTFTGTLPAGVTGKDVIVALCGLFKSDVLNHAIEFTGSEETMASLPVDTRTTIANMSTEWGGLTGLFPIDRTLERWLREKATMAAKLGNQRITHERIDELFANPLTADPGARYAKQLYLNLSSLSPYVSGPNSVKISTPLNELAPRKIKVNRAYIVSCTNGRASDFAAAAKVFKDAAAKTSSGAIPKIADGVQLYIGAASAPEQEAAEAAGDWQALLDAGAQEMPAGCSQCIGLGRGLLEDGEVGISASNRNFKGRLGSRSAEAYLASPEVVAASALSGVISGPGVYQVPENWSGVEHGFGTGSQSTPETEIDNIVQQLDSLIERVESDASDQSGSVATEILPGFPEKISGEILFLDADNLDTDAIYPGKMTYQDNVSKEDMAAACMQNYDPEFRTIAKPNDVVVSGYNFGCGSSREQAATALLAKGIPLVVASSFGNIFARNSINNALLGLEVPRLVQRLREHFSSGDKGSSRQLTRRTGWTLKWDVKRSVIEVREGEGGETWTEKVGELPANVQEIIAAGGLEAWVKAQIAKPAAS